MHKNSSCGLERTDEFAQPLDELDLGLVEVPPVDPVQPLDVRIPLRLQGPSRRIVMLNELDNQL